jgi:hypothetical protein
MLRLAAQLISRRAVSPDTLLALAERERVRPILAELARQPLRVDGTHPLWQWLAQRLGDEKPLHDRLLHWTRLAKPVMKDGCCNAAEPIRPWGPFESRPLSAFMGLAHQEPCKASVKGRY